MTPSPKKIHSQMMQASPQHLISQEYSWPQVTIWSRKWQPTPVCLPGEFRGQRTLTGYSTWGHKESDMTEPTQITIRDRQSTGNAQLHLAGFCSLPIYIRFAKVLQKTVLKHIIMYQSIIFVYYQQTCLLFSLSLFFFTDVEL